MFRKRDAPLAQKKENDYKIAKIFRRAEFRLWNKIE
jgi:hypothetical protein